MNRLIGSHLARLPRLAASQQQLISARYATEYVYNKIVYVCVCVIAHIIVCMYGCECLQAQWKCMCICKCGCGC